MGLRFKFNLVLFGSLLSLLLLIYWLHRQEILLQETIETQHKAALIYQTAESIRNYNSLEVAPLLEQLEAGFLPQSIGSYSASQTFNDLQKNLPNFSYKVAIKDSSVNLYQANVWQSDIIKQFSTNPELPVYTRQLADAQGAFYAYAKPIVTNNQVEGAKIVRINLSEQQATTQQALNKFALMLASLLVAAMVVLNLMMHVLVIKPLKRMASQAELISQGQAEIDEIEIHGHDEISQLGLAFNRLQRSLKAAMSLLS